MSNVGSYCDSCRLLRRGTEGLVKTEQQIKNGNYAGVLTQYKDSKGDILTVRDVTAARGRDAALGLAQDLKNLLGILEQGRKEHGLGFPTIEEQAKILAEAAEQVAKEAEELENGYSLKV